MPSSQQFSGTVSLSSGAVIIKLLRGESHISNLFTLLLSCLVYFYFVLFVSFIKNQKIYSYLLLVYFPVIMSSSLLAINCYFP